MHFDIQSVFCLQLRLNPMCDGAEETRKEMAACAAHGRHTRLPLLLTSLCRIESVANPHCLLGRIWREPAAAFDERGYWLPPHGTRRGQA